MLERGCSRSWVSLDLTEAEAAHAGDDCALRAMSAHGGTGDLPQAADASCAAPRAFARLVTLQTVSVPAFEANCRRKPRAIARHLR